MVPLGMKGVVYLMMLKQQSLANVELQINRAFETLARCYYLLPRAPSPENRHAGAGGGGGGGLQPPNFLPLCYIEGVCF